MARPKKIGLDYFPVDTVFDDKIQAIELLHGNDGLVFIIKYWQAAYQTETGEIDISGINHTLLANKCRITAEKLSEIIKNCIELNLIYRTESGLYTSNGIKKRIDTVNTERKRSSERQEEKKDKLNINLKEKETPHYSANNSGYLPNNSGEINKTENLPELYKQFISKSPPYWQVSFEREVYGAFQGLFQTSKPLAILAVGLIEKYALYCLKSGKNGQYIGRPEKWFREMAQYGYKYDYEARYAIEKKDTPEHKHENVQAPKEWKPKEIPDEELADPEEIKNILESIANKFSAKY